MCTILTAVRVPNGLPCLNSVSRIIVKIILGKKEPGIQVFVNNQKTVVAGETVAVRRMYDYLKEYLILNIGGTAKAVGLSYNTVSAAIRKLINAGSYRNRRQWREIGYLSICRIWPF